MELSEQDALRVLLQEVASDLSEALREDGNPELDYIVVVQHKDSKEVSAMATTMTQNEVSESFQAWVDSINKGQN